jgi:hypothetical protein
MQKTEQKAEFEFTLDIPISHHKQGDTEDCSMLILRAPSYKNRKASIKLKQGFMRALKSLEGSGGNQTSKNKQSDENPFTSESIIAALFMSNVDLNDILDDFEQLLLHGCCFIPPEIQFTNFHYRQISPDDITRLLGEYIENFMIPSWMIQLTNKSNT